MNDSTYVLRRLLPDLSAPTRRVAEYLLSDPAGASRSSITVVARECEVAPSTVSRLAERAGYGGYPALRTALATENGRAIQSGWEQDIGTEILVDDSAERVLGVLAAQQHRVARACTDGIDPEAADAAATAICEASRVMLYGEWADAVPLRELRLRLYRIGVSAWQDSDAPTARIGTEALGTGDVLILLTRNGQERVYMDLAARAQRRGASVLLLTADPDCRIAEYADHVLFTAMPPGGSWTDIFAGRAADTLACSLLWLLVAQRMPEALGRFPSVDADH